MQGGRGGGRGIGRGPLPNDICKACGKLGHWSRDCPMRFQGVPAMGVDISTHARYATRVKAMAGGRAVIAPKQTGGQLAGEPRHTGAPHGVASDAIARQQAGSSELSALQAADLIALAAQLRPAGMTGQCVTYAAPDLVWAQPMASDELATLYTQPATEFRAGLGFDNASFWEEIAVGNTEVLRWVHGGYSEFVAEVIPVIRQANNKNTGGENSQFVAEAIQELLSVGAVVEVTAREQDREVVRVGAPLTVAVQGNGKQRLCWNGIPVNKYMPSQSFKMEHAEFAARLMRKGDFMFSLDMKAGYHQVPVKPWFRKFLCFEWGEGPDRKRWRAKGVRCSNYIDDFIFFAPTMARALEIRAMVLADLTRLGWFISPNKSMLQPGTLIEYLGLVFCSLPEPHVRVPLRKVERAQQLFDGVLKKAAAVGTAGVQAGAVRTTGLHLAKTLGFLQSLRLAVALVPVFTRELYACLNSLPKVDDGWLVYGSVVSLSSAALEECKFWQQGIARWNGFVVSPVSVTRVLYTDGCGSGFGGLVHRVLAREVEPAFQLLAGSWEDAMSEDSVMTELEGLWRTIIGAGSSLMGQVVLHRTDSISTYAVVSKGGSSRSGRLTDVARRLQVYCMIHDITLATQYVGSEVIIRSGADMLSRSIDFSDGGKLNPRVFERLWRAIMGPVEVTRLHVPHVDGPLFVQGRKNMVPHPLGAFTNRDAVIWVAVLLGPK
eukprot:gene3268-3545_t